MDKLSGFFRTYTEISTNLKKDGLNKKKNISNVNGHTDTI